MNQMEDFRYPDGDTIAASDVKNFVGKVMDPNHSFCYRGQLMSQRTHS